MVFRQSVTAAAREVVQMHMGLAELREEPEKYLALDFSALLETMGLVVLTPTRIITSQPAQIATAAIAQASPITNCHTRAGSLIRFVSASRS
jgi:hypothetical protein